MPYSPAVEHFSRLANRYTQVRAGWPQSALRRQEQRALHDLVDVAPGSRVLDVGCGDGETLAWLARRGAQGVGVDVTWAMAAACRHRGFEVLVQDMEHLGVRSQFDWVFCIGSLEFTRNPALVIESFARCLRPGGQLALLFPQRHWLGWLYAAYHRSHGVRVRLFSRTDIFTWLKRAGLRPRARREGILSTLCVAERPAAESAEHPSP